MRILVAHDGRSLQSLNGRQYNFYFGVRPEDTPFFWDVSYDILSGSVDQAKPEPISYLSAHKPSATPNGIRTHRFCLLDRALTASFCTYAGSPSPDI